MLRPISSTRFRPRGFPQLDLAFSAAHIAPMKKDVVQVQIRGLLPANSGCALFVGNDEKVFVIQVDSSTWAMSSAWPCAALITSVRSPMT
jgi:hypothetical protein